MNMFVCLSMSVSMCIYVCLSVSVSMCAYVFLSVSVSMFVCLSVVCLSECVHVCICL